MTILPPCPFPGPPRPAPSGPICACSGTGGRARNGSPPCSPSLIPIGILVAFYLDAKTNIAPGPQLIMVESWPATRTDAEIREKQQRDRAAREARERERQREFQEARQRA